MPAQKPQGSECLRKSRPPKNAELIAAGRAGEVKICAYSGKPTYYQQIWTLIQTVFFGVFTATILAVLLGILSGLSPKASAAINTPVQIFKSVSPLAWLPIVTMVVSAAAANGERPCR